MPLPNVRLWLGAEHNQPLDSDAYLNRMSGDRLRIVRVFRGRVIAT